MSERLLLLNIVRSIFSYSQIDGVLRWDKPTNKRIVRGSAVGSMRDDGYLEAQVNGVRVRVHRLIWLFVHGVWPNQDIDHINGNRSDNRIENLRDVSRKTNLQNQRTARKGTVSGLLGVSWMKSDKRWQAKITVDGVCKHIGQFLTPEDAHAAYVEKKREMHGGCTI